MKTQYDNEAKAREYLAKISTNTLFESSPKYAELLTYLVEKALNGEHLKEFTIGVEFFKKSYENEVSDSAVRVKMHNLRKKLAAYYGSEGSEDEIKFCFESRSYNLLIKSNPRRAAMRFNRSVAATLAALLLLVVVGLAVSRSLRTEYFWHYFMDHNTPTICILADHLVLKTKIDGATVALYHPQITTKKEFEQHKTEQYRSGVNIDTLTIRDFTFFTRSIPYAMQRLGWFYGRHNHHFTQLYERDFDFSVAKDANIIYVGQLKLMDRSKLIFLQNSSKFRYENNIYHVTGSDGRVVKYAPKFANDEVCTEYGVVSYMPMSNGKRALFFTSDNDIGVMATIDKFTDRAFLKQLYRQLNDKDSYFNILYRVDGAGRTNLKFEIIEIEEFQTK